MDNQQKSRWKELYKEHFLIKETINLSPNPSENYKSNQSKALILSAIKLFFTFLLMT